MKKNLLLILCLMVAIGAGTKQKRQVKPLNFDASKSKVMTMPMGNVVKYTAYTGRMAAEPSEPVAVEASGRALYMNHISRQWESRQRCELQTSLEPSSLWRSCIE
jgi:hypothetical protein